MDARLLGAHGTGRDRHKRRGDQPAVAAVAEILTPGASPGNTPLNCASSPQPCTPVRDPVLTPCPPLRDAERGDGRTTEGEVDSAAPPSVCSAIIGALPNLLPTPSRL